MKKSKYVLFGVAASVVLLTSGCTAKESKLVCTQTASGVDVTFNVGFKGNIIKTMDFSYDMDLSSYTDSQISTIGKQDLCSSVKSSMSEYKEAFTDCKQKVDNKHLKVEAKLSVDKLAKNMLDKMESPESAKKELEAEGYSCTIK